MRWPALPNWTWDGAPGPRAWVVAVSAVLVQTAVAAWGLAVLR